MTEARVQVKLQKCSEMAVRGLRLQKVALGIRNVKATTIGRMVADLLESEDWREYELPNGQCYEWRASEFDYFLMAIDLDPVIIEQAVRSLGDRELVLDLVSACTGAPDNRRSLAAIRAEHPEIAGRLHDIRVGGQLRSIAQSPEARKRYVAGSSASSSRDAREWFTVGWKRGLAQSGQAGHIAKRLIARNPQLAEAVAHEITSNLTSRPD